MIDFVINLNKLVKPKGQRSMSNPKKFEVKYNHARDTEMVSIEDFWH